MSTTTSHAGTDWHEDYLGGSKEAEDNMIRKRFVPEVNRIQRDIREIEEKHSIGRAQHGKMLAGISNAHFDISPDIPSDLQLGLFRPGQSYPALVRFSNASSFEQIDAARDLRGAALRVISDGGKEHDFLMTNAPFSHARDARQFMTIASAVTRRGRPAIIWKSSAGRLVPGLLRIARRLGVQEALRVLRTIRTQTSRPVTSLAAEQYWSRAPFAFGPVALKFKLQPSANEGAPDPNSTPTPDLRRELIARLNKGPVEFDFRVQRYVDPDKTPIEDGTVEWTEADSPFTTIARLVIPQQTLDPDVEIKVNNLAFNPWITSSEDIRPLGSMNRARKLVYEASAHLRQADDR